jgi:outer membrane lipoprotein SlyB
MKKSASRAALFAALSLVSLGGCTEYDDRRGAYAPPSEGPYYADQYYREGPNYEERRLSYDDQVYVGRDGRYYCKRNDGTTGLIVGGIAGGVLGNIIAPGGSKTLGTLLGAAGGAAVGTSIDRDNVRCR